MYNYFKGQHFLRHRSAVSFRPRFQKYVEADLKFIPQMKLLLDYVV